MASFYKKPAPSNGKKKGFPVKTALVLLAVAAVALFLFITAPKSPPTPSSGWWSAYTENGTKVAIVEFSDFQCPYCSRAVPVVRELEKTYGSKINFVFKNFPLPMHEFAQKAAEAAECARDQGFFDAYHDKLFANQLSLNVDSLKKYARDVGADGAKFDSCLDGGSKAAKVQADLNEGVSLGVRATPTFFVNGEKIEGAQPASAFTPVIDSMVAR
jgi:protein-disulfide isomerase